MIPNLQGLRASGSSPTFLLDNFLSQCIIDFIVFLAQLKRKFRQNRSTTERLKTSIIQEYLLGKNVGTYAEDQSAMFEAICQKTLFATYPKVFTL